MIAILGSARAYNAADEIGASHFTLSNGLHVVFSPAPGKLGVAVAVGYRVGATTEDASTAGTAHILEHMMTDIEVSPLQRGFPSIIERIGGISNAKTTFTGTIFYEYAPKSDLDYILSLEAYRMVHLRPTTMDLEREKQAAINEYQETIQVRPYGTSIEQMIALSAPTFEYAHLPVGSTKSIQSLTLPTAIEFYDRFYTPQNCTVVIVGDFKKNDVWLVVRHRLAGINKKAARPQAVLLPKPIRSAPAIVYRESSIPGTRIDITYRVPSRTPVERAAINILAEVLDGRVRRLPTPTAPIASGKVSVVDEGDTSLVWISAVVESRASWNGIFDQICREVSSFKGSQLREEEIAQLHLTLIDRLASLSDDPMLRAMTVASEAIMFRTTDSLNSVTRLQFGLSRRLLSRVDNLAREFLPITLVTRCSDNLVRTSENNLKR
jgi:predicted Zn-dependent peptidase